MLHLRRTHVALVAYNMAFDLLLQPNACEALGPSEVYRLTASSAAISLQPAAARMISAAALGPHLNHHVLRVFLADVAYHAITLLRNQLTVAQRRAGQPYVRALLATLCQLARVRAQLPSSPSGTMRTQQVRGWRLPN